MCGAVPARAEVCLLVVDDRCGVPDVALVHPASSAAAAANAADAMSGRGTSER